MQSNRLLLNADKTEIIWCIPLRRRGLLPSGELAVGDVTVLLIEVARHLGDRSLRTHVSHTV